MVFYHHEPESPVEPQRRFVRNKDRMTERDTGCRGFLLKLRDEVLADSPVAIFRQDRDVQEADLGGGAVYPDSANIGTM